MSKREETYWWWESSRQGWGRRGKSQSPIWLSLRSAESNNSDADQHAGVDHDADHHHDAGGHAVIKYQLIWSFG